MSSSAELVLLDSCQSVWWLQEQQGAAASPVDTEDAEKVNMRRQIEQLELAAAALQMQGSSHVAEQSGVADEERLEAALQQQQLQARIDQLEAGAHYLFQVMHLADFNSYFS